MRRMQPAALAALAMAALPLALMPGAAAAQGTDAAAQALYMQSLGANCAHCHGFEGRPKPGTLPDLAGRPRDELLKLMTEYRSGARKGTIMPQIAKGYSESQLAALATYFAAQKP